MCLRTLCVHAGHPGIDSQHMFACLHATSKTVHCTPHCIRPQQQQVHMLARLMFEVLQQTGTCNGIRKGRHVCMSR